MSESLLVRETCPRGHGLDDNAVYCHVCWVRVAPEAPERVAERRQRRRRIWLPFAAVTAVAAGVALGAVLARTGSTPTSVVAAPAAPAPVAVTAAGTAADSAGPVAVTAVAEAATVASSCSVTLLGQQAACSLADSAITMRACLPAGTAGVDVRELVTAGGAWSDVVATTAAAPGSECNPSEVSLSVTVPNFDATAAKWRMVGRTADGTKLWSTPIQISVA